MKILRLFAVALTLVCGSATSYAQSASDYQTNKPFGWAACKTLSGESYAMDGGMHGMAEGKYPSIITLTASGGDDYNAISNAIKKYDIIILDGSKGDFILSTKIKLRDIANRTILGTANARLCTQFYITPELTAALKAYGIRSGSGSGTGGTLSNGVYVDEQRCFDTRQAIINFTGDNKENYRNAGIFDLNETDQNIIIRNIVFQGPGSVDVDGSDLISNNGATHIWVDHCEFIDGEDGNLDSGKRKDNDMYVTYSWNIFRYTERSFSHSYSNGVGWMDAANKQQITYAYNIWGNGCDRRLPQADMVNIHLLNNYYNCPGNSVGMALNSNTNALIEGVNVAKNVKAFTPGKYSTLIYEVRDCNFTATSNGSVSVPYTYKAIPCSDVPTVLTGALGAGATLTDLQLRPYYNNDGDVASNRSWDFTTWSSQTASAIATDTQHWTYDSSSSLYKNKTIDGTTTAQLLVGSTHIPECEGLYFNISRADNLGIQITGESRIRLLRNTTTVTIPSLKAGDIIRLSQKTASSSEARGFTATNATTPDAPQAGKTIYSQTFTVTADGDVTLTPTGGLYLYSIEVNPSSTSSIALHNKQAEPNTSLSYTLAGQPTTAPLHGLIIQNGKTFALK